jgi:hypothetical protein
MQMHSGTGTVSLTGCIAGQHCQGVPRCYLHGACERLCVRAVPQQAAAAALAAQAGLAAAVAEGAQGVAHMVCQAVAVMPQQASCTHTSPPDNTDVSSSRSQTYQQRHMFPITRRETSRQPGKLISAHMSHAAGIECQAQDAAPSKPLSCRCRAACTGAPGCGGSPVMESTVLCCWNASEEAES